MGASRRPTSRPTSSEGGALERRGAGGTCRHKNSALRYAKARRPEQKLPHTRTPTKAPLPSPRLTEWQHAHVVRQSGPPRRDSLPRTAVPPPSCCDSVTQILRLFFGRGHTWRPPSAGSLLVRKCSFSPPRSVSRSTREQRTDSCLVLRKAAAGSCEAMGWWATKVWPSVDRARLVLILAES